MKKTILLFVMLFPALSMAQSKVIDELKDQFKGNEAVTSFSLSGNFFNMSQWFECENEEDEAVKNLIEGIDRMSILTIPIGTHGIQKKQLKGLRNDINKENFEDLMVIRDGNDKINVMVKEKDGIISNLLMLIDDNQELTILDFSGRISMDDVALLTDNVNIN